MARPRTDAGPDTPKVLEKALRILESFGGESTGWTEGALRAHLAMPSTTLNRLLRSLESAGYVLRDEDGRYRLGIAAVRLGLRASASLNLPAVLDTELRRLATGTEELVILAMPEFSSGLARYVATVDSRKRLRVTAEVGTGVPLTAGATAKTLLAFQPPPQIDAVLTQPRERLAAGTVTGAKAIREQLDRDSPAGVGTELGGDLRRGVGAGGAGARRRRPCLRVDRGRGPDQPPQQHDRGQDPPGGDRRRRPRGGEARRSEGRSSWPRRRRSSARL